MSDQTEQAAPAAEDGATTLPADAPAEAPAADAAEVVAGEPEVVSAEGEVKLTQFRVTFQPSLIAVLVDDLDAVKAENNARRALGEIAAGDASVEAL